MDKAFLLKKAPMAAAVALAVAMATSFGLQGYRAWQQGQALDQPVASDRLSTRPQASQAQITDVTRGHLFGQPQATQSQQPLQTENLPATNLRLTLRGVSASSGEESASVLVEGPDQQTQVYRIGDNLPGNAILRAIYPTRVVIERNGRLENLYFPEQDDSSAAIPVYQDIPTYEEPAPEPDYSTYTEYQADTEVVEPVPEETPVANAVPQVEASTPAPQPQAAVGGSTAPDPAQVLDTLSEERKQEIRERLQRLREQIINH